MTQNLIEFIKQLIPFTDEEISKVQNFFVEKTLRKNEFWVKENEFNSDFAYVNKGMLRAYFIKDKIEKTFDLIIENQVITTSQCFVSGLPSTSYVQAIEDTYISVITKDNLEFLYSKSSKWEQLRRIMFEYQILEQEIRIRSFIAEIAEERYERLVMENPKLIQRTPQIYLANFLGITPQSLSRLRRKIISK